MQLSELLGPVVLDAAAQRVGTVVDVRLTVDGDLDDNPDLPTMFVFGCLARGHARPTWGMNAPTPADPRC